MRKIICDRCDSECVNYHAQMFIRGTHTLNTGEIVIDDDESEHHVSYDLCASCIKSLEHWLGKTLGMLTQAEVESRARQRKAARMADRLDMLPAERAHP